jgi:hypothetical protein
MDPLPVKIVPKTITNIEELKSVVRKQTDSKMYWYHLRSDFISEEVPPVEFEEEDDEILDKLETQIQELCKDLPHKRIVLSIRQVGQKLEVTINPLTCTA